MKRAVFLISLILLCIGQSFGPKIVKGPLPIAYDAAFPSGLKYWWVQSDISTNATTPATWNDKIQNTGFVKGGYGSITNRADGGLIFTNEDVAEHQLYMTSTNSMLMGGTNTTVWMLVRTDHVQAGQKSYYMYGDGASDALDFDEPTRVWTLTSAGTSPGQVTSDTGSTEWLFELCFSWHTNGGICFTNGTSSKTIARPDAWQNIHLGAKLDSSTYPRGCTFLEVRYYTNFLTQANMTWLHNYVLTNYPVYTDANKYLLASYDVSEEAYNDGDAISSVGDQGPYNLDLTGTGTARPYWTNNAGEINDEGYAYFDGSNDNLTNWYNATYPQPSHVIAVCRPISNAAGYAAALGDNGNTATEQFLYSVGTTAVASLYAGAFLNSAAIDMFKWTVFDALFEGQYSSIKTNNVTIITGNAGGNARINGVTIGADSLQGTFAKQAFAYLGIYTNKLNSIQASNEVQRLGTKFGITTYTRDFP